MIQLLSLLVLLFCCAHRWCWPFVGGGSDFFWLDAGVVQMPVCAQGWEGAHNLACLRGHSIKSPCYIHFHAHSWGNDRQVHWRRHHGLLVRPRSIPSAPPGVPFSFSALCVGRNAPPLYNLSPVLRGSLTSHLIRRLSCVTVLVAFLCPGM